jgi:hypothetical protein
MPLPLQLREQALNSDYNVSMQSSLDDYEAMLSFNRKVKPRVLHVSYEKLIQNKVAYTKTFSEFCDVELTASKQLVFMDCIASSPPSYLIWSDIFRQQADLKKHGFSGGLLQIKKPGLVMLDVYNNKKWLTKIIADMPRADLIDAGLSMTGKAAFSVKLNTLSVGDEVAVTVHCSQLGFTARYTL